MLDQVHAFRYVTFDNAPNYRAIVQVFFEAKERYEIELRPADVRDRLGRSGLHHELPGDAELDRHLDQLAEWGNLQRAHDTGAVSRIDDFYRRRYLYRLTAVGEAAHRAVAEVEATVGRSGALQASMLSEILDALGALVSAARGGDGTGVVRALHRLRTAFESLTTEAKRFLGGLDRHTSAERLDEARYLSHKHALLAYLGRFVADLKRLAPEISARIAEVEALDPAALLAAASRTAELPPALDGEDPARRWIADERARWDGVRAWFLPAGAEPPRLDSLQSRARESVVRLTRALARLDERHARAADRAADFRTLARWFSDCDGDRAAHALYHAAFGLHPARHLHVAEEDPELTRTSTSWWDAPPVEIPVRLRTHGAVSRSGRPPAVLDFSDGRAWLAARRRRERAQVEAALARFTGRGPLRLSQLASLDLGEFDLLLALLDEALCAPRGADGARRTRSSDGRLDLALRAPAASEDRPWVTLATPAGRLRCVDYAVEVAPALPARSAAREGGAP